MDSFNKSNLQNIKNIFEERTGVELESKHKTVHHPIKRIALTAAVLTCVLTLTGFAVAATLGVGDILKSFFSDRQKNSLSSGQNEYIDNRTATIGESVTQDGVTVTVTGAISDGTMAYILVDIVAPSDQNIEALPLGFDVEFERLKLEGQEKEHISSVSAGCILLSDYDGLDNTASMLIQYNIYQFRGSNFTFTDGKNRTLQLKDLFYYETDYPYSLCTVAEGMWEYEFAFTAVDDKEVELLAAPVSASYSQISGKWVDATITSIETKGLSAVVYYTLDPNEVQEAGDFGILKFVMKDGSIINAYPQKAGQISQIENGNLIPNTSSHYCSYVFDAPVNYEDITSLYIGDMAIDTNGQ